MQGAERLPPRRWGREIDCETRIGHSASTEKNKTQQHTSWGYDNATRGTRRDACESYTRAHAHLNRERKRENEKRRMARGTVLEWSSPPYMPVPVSSLFALCENTHRHSSTQSRRGDRRGEGLRYSPQPRETPESAYGVLLLIRNPLLLLQMRAVRRRTLKNTKWKRRRVQQ